VDVSCGVEVRFGLWPALLCWLVVIDTMRRSSSGPGATDPRWTSCWNGSSTRQGQKSGSQRVWVQLGPRVWFQRVWFQRSVRSFLSRVKCGLRPPPLIAGPVRSSLRCGRPARRRRMTKGPMTEEETPQPPGPARSGLAVVVRPGRPSPQPILVTVNHHRPRPCPLRDHACA
jgi:hypothetical protein